MNSETILEIYDIGDLVCFNGVALFYQTVNVMCDKLYEQKLGTVLKKTKFSGHPAPDPRDCQEIIDSEVCIQEPMYVYTILCDSSVVEVLDIDVRYSL